MFEETKNNLVKSAKEKVVFLNMSSSKFLLSSILAGAYVGFGIFLIMVIGGIATDAASPYTKIFMGLSFAIALALVIMSGSELFTGNNFIMMVASLDKKVSWKNSLRVWYLSYIGNFIGSFLIAGLFVLTALNNTLTGDFILNVAANKMSSDFSVLLVKGILCNILVCLAILSSFRLNSESAKIMMIFFCLFAFITSGFEHSVANMTIFGMSLFLKHPESISITGMLANLIPVTIGNFIGGGLILGGSYYYLGKK